MGKRREVFLVEGEGLMMRLRGGAADNDKINACTFFQYNFD